MLCPLPTSPPRGPHMPLSHAPTPHLERPIPSYPNLAPPRDTRPLALDRGAGVRVFDDGGRRYIEGLAGL